MLLGRERERQAITEALDRARHGTSTALVLVGEPGIGKSALLEEVPAEADGMRILRVRGVESEAQIPFAALLELLRPALGGLARIPRPQADALEAALALRPAGTHERFAVGAATLSLLAAHAEDEPVALVIDDAQWLDASSAEAIRFALRRMLADPVAAILAVREGHPSLIDGTDLPVLALSGLSRDEALRLVPGLPPELARRLHDETAGNPLAMLELGAEPDPAALVARGTPIPVPERISAAFRRRMMALDADARRAVCLSAASDTGDLAVLERAARRVGIEPEALMRAADQGLVTLSDARIEFRHPLARAAAYAAASAEERREAHRALASILPDIDVDRRAWHLAAAAVGVDETASEALEQAALRGVERSSYATASAAFERAARLTAGGERRPRLLLRAGESAWNGGLPERAGALLEEARSAARRPETLVEIDELTGYIAASHGPIMQGHAILVDAAERAQPERSVRMLAEATVACFYAGQPRQAIETATRAEARAPAAASAQARFLATVAAGAAHVVGGDAAAGAERIRAAINLAEETPTLSDDTQLLPWLVIATIFLREGDTGRELLSRALAAARERAALSSLPTVLNLIARDHATTDRLSEAEAIYLESIGLARETDQRLPLAFALSGLAWLWARRGREQQAREGAAEAMILAEAIGARLNEVWATIALGELELAAGRSHQAIEHFRRQRQLLVELGISDPDLSPVPELVEALLHTGQAEETQELVEELTEAAAAKGQPWSLARAARARGLVAPDSELNQSFEEALSYHAQTVDAFETARTQLAFGERLRRARNRRAAREQLRAALEAFERLEAAPWAERARVELVASGETLRRRDPASLDELTPQELQISLLLAEGRTTREAAAALFLSPKTVEYHLRHVYMKLSIHSREELAKAVLPAGPD